ncbi:hypothetical protein [Flectobacillus major]|jgi:hypothetical protein|uniref:hypothetical protein n=1 Tax=Flectobacillus major TaxID=103 RepID=UPI00042724EF|nr:hypothetical protein [Flectobacillus major]
MMNHSKKASNRLERFVRDNRDEFENFEPSVGLWDKIEQHLPANQDETKTVKKNNIITIIPDVQRYWRVVATVALVLGISSVYFFRKQTESSDLIVNQVNPQYSKQMVHYANLIETKRDEIKQIATNEPALYKEFSEEIERLNHDYQSLRAELPQTPNQEELVKAMIQNLQVQLDILNQQLSIIHKVKEAKKNHGKIIQNI